MRGRIYDFETGEERPGPVEIRRHGTVWKRFAADGRFRVRMPIDADASPLPKEDTTPPVTKMYLPIMVSIVGGRVNVIRIQS